MNHTDYIRCLLPILHASAELHRVEGTVSMTEGERAVLRVKVENVRSAIASLYGFQLGLANIPEVSGLLVDRFPADDEQG